MFNEAQTSIFYSGKSAKYRNQQLDAYLLGKSKYRTASISIKLLSCVLLYIKKLVWGNHSASVYQSEFKMKKKNYKPS